MMLRNTADTYGLVAQGLHWLVAGLIVSMLALGFWMTGLPLEDEAQVQRTIFYYSLHKTIGIATLAVVLLRLGWAAVSVRPAPLNAGRPLEAFAAATVHWVLYAAILLMPVTGWLHHAAHAGTAPIWWPPGLSLGQELPLVPKSDALSHLFGTMHGVLAWLILGAVALHVAGALKHAVLDRDRTLARMLPFADRDASAANAAAPSLHAGSHPRSSKPLAAAGAVLAAILALAVVLALAGEEESGPAAAMPVAAGNSVVDHDESRLAISVRLMGSEVQGRFDRWQAQIAFDPDDLAGSRVAVRIDTASLRLGDVSSQARDPAYLDTATYPEARFDADRFERTGAGGYLAEGLVSLRGTEAAVTLPFDLEIEGDTARMTGHTRLDRLAFGIGAEAMPGEDTLAFPVEVTVTLLARRADPAGGPDTGR